MSNENNQSDKERYDLMRKDKKFGIVQVIQILLTIGMLIALYIFLVGYREALVSVSMYIVILVVLFSFIAYRLFK